MGTLNGDTLGLALVIQFDLRDGPLEGLVSIEVRGPEGWNNNQVLKLETGFLGNETDFTPRSFFRTGITPVTGTYQISFTVENQKFDYIAKINISQRLARPQNVKAVSNGFTTRVSWHPVEQAKIYVIRAISILSEEDQLLAIQSTLETEVTLPVIPIEGENQQAIVIAYNHNVYDKDGVPEQFNASMTQVPVQLPTQ
jgi:hypothetical protein